MTTFLKGWRLQIHQRDLRKLLFGPSLRPPSLRAPRRSTATPVPSPPASAPARQAVALKDGALGLGPLAIGALLPFLSLGGGFPFSNRQQRESMSSSRFSRKSMFSSRFSIFSRGVSLRTWRVTPAPSERPLGIKEAPPLGGSVWDRFGPPLSLPLLFWYRQTRKLVPTYSNRSAGGPRSLSFLWAVLAAAFWQESLQNAAEDMGWMCKCAELDFFWSTSICLRIWFYGFKQNSSLLEILYFFLGP